MPKKIFESFHPLVFESNELPSSEAERIVAILDEHCVSYEVHQIQEQISSKTFVNKGFTHVISNSVLFDLYHFTTENLIPTVTSDYVFDCVKRQRQQNFRPYSPDPKHVLKSVHICIGNLPESDKETIYGGVRALGGTFSETLNKYVTHVISNDPNEDCVLAVQAVADYNIKAVLPSWIDHCLKLRKKLDETRYILGDIPVMEQEREITKLDVLNKKHNEIEVRDQFLNGRKFYLGKDLRLTEMSKSLLTNLIEGSGGEVVDQLAESKYYIGQYRSGEEYIWASRNKLYVGNPNWIYWMVEHQKWISPYKKLLHYPYVEGGLTGMEEFRIVASNYAGDQRFYIKNLINALGARFSGNLAKSDTHLITPTAMGKKYEAALKWNQIVLNHLWLEESYAKWKVQPTNHPRYSANISKNLSLDEIVGETSLDVEVLKKFYEDGSFSDDVTHLVEDSDEDLGSVIETDTFKNGSAQELGMLNINKDEINGEVVEIQENEVETDEVKEVTPTPVSKKTVLAVKKQTETNIEETRLTSSSSKPTPIKSCASKKVKSLLSDEPSIKETPEKQTVTVSAETIRHSSGRKAKDKAAQKLHSDMEELNYFQKQHRSKDVPLLPHEIEERKRKRMEEAENKVAKRSASVEPDAKIATDVKDMSHETPKSKKSKVSMHYSIDAIATGFEVDFARGDLTILNSLGIHIQKEFKNDINTIIAPKFMRTEKFLLGLSYNLSYIISPEFIKRVLKEVKTNPENPNLPKVEKFALDVINPKSVRELTTLSIQQLAEKTREHANDKLFHGFVFNITSKLPGGATTIQKILRSHGAKDVKVIKTIKEIKNLKSFKANKDGSILLISNEKGISEKFKATIESEGLKDCKIIEWDWVISSIFNMDVNGKKHVVYRS